jgi:hypothetical protein
MLLKLILRNSICRCDEAKCSEYSSETILGLLQGHTWIDRRGRPKMCRRVRVECESHGVFSRIICDPLE